jgi:hypothetical protein
MTQEEYIQLAIEAGITPWTKHEYIGGNNFSASDEGLDGDAASLIQFAQLVAAAEREACAKVCDNTFYSVEAAQKIRARGEA